MVKFIVRITWTLWLFAYCARGEPVCGNPFVESWFGHPKFDDCHELLFGDNDLSGMAAIDSLRHAFIVPGMEQQYESASEWQNRIELPIFWSNGEGYSPNTPAQESHRRATLTSIKARCKIALMPYTADLSTIETPWASRDTGDWLSIAERGASINQFCVRERQSGGLQEVGNGYRLLLVLYDAASRQNREIEADLAMGVVPAVRREFEGSIASSIGDDIADLDEELADILNINDEIGHSHARAGREHAFGYSHVGKADPSAKNLGASWVLTYNSIISLTPEDHAADGLKGFYNNVTDIAARKIANNTEMVKSLNFVSRGLSLRLTSTSPISWEWIIRFARLMSELVNFQWAVLYNIVAKNSYWNVASILAVLVAP
ncbi:MAG: hypothetical protein Q9222_007791 [Ikaeria aurantiellina]